MNGTKAQYRLLFEPIKIGPVTAPNRFYAVPHATGHGNLQPNSSNALREMKARGGWGVVSMQITEISPDSDLASHPIERLWDDSDLPTHQMFTERVKSHGSLAAIELGHGGMRCRNFVSGSPVMGPSHLPIIAPEFPVQAKAMSKRDITHFRDSHRRAARAAKRAGYDIIYVYAAHDISLLSHFLSRRYNHRSDEYGGKLENRVRLLREVLEDTRDVVGDQCAVALRFAVAEPGTERGLSHKEEGHDVVEMLADLPDLWDVNISGWSKDSQTTRFSEEGYQLEFTDFVKRITDKPVVGVGRFTSVDKMVSLIKSGRLDLIGAARPSIADPFLPDKIKRDRIDDIRECIGCNICVASDNYGVPLRCTQNPTIGEEWRRNWHPEKVPTTSVPESVLIIGAGPAGLECALTLGRAGHQVTLVDSADEVGGRLNRESALRGLHAWGRVREYRLYQLQQMPNVDIYLQSELDAETAIAFEADRIVVATGASWRRDGVGGSQPWPLEISDNSKVLTPDDIMGDVELSGHVFVYDDDHYYMGGVIAGQLREAGCSVTLATPLPTISAWTNYTLEQTTVVQDLVDRGVVCRTGMKLSKIAHDKAEFIATSTGTMLDILEYDHLVFVGARYPSTDLYERLVEMAGEEKVVAIGDCLVPGTIQAAVYSGHRAARLINGDPLAGNEFRREQPIIFNNYLAAPKEIAL
ncbi:MAG: FAD-dependent oxidoreductase [Methyloligellaceae bacterium]